MTKLGIFVSFIAAVMGIITGAIAVYQFLQPSPVETPADLLAALDRIADEVASSNFSTDSIEERELIEALDQFTLRVSQNLPTEETDPQGIPRSFAGVSKYPHNVAFDYVAPNGESRLFVAKAFNDSLAQFLVDGEGTDLIGIGQNLIIPFGSMDCRFDLIETSRGDYIRVRSACD
jgi:hypothetical protein